MLLVELAQKTVVIICFYLLNLLQARLNTHFHKTSTITYDKPLN